MADRIRWQEVGRGGDGLLVEVWSGRCTRLRAVEFERVLDAEEILVEEGMRIGRAFRLKRAECILELAYAIAHLDYFSVELLGVCEDEPGGG